MRRSRAAILGAPIALAAAVAVLRPRPATDPGRGRPLEDAPVVQPARRFATEPERHLSGRPSAAGAALDGEHPLPRSLRETDVDGWIGVDDDGRLVVTPGARWFFDYFLSATGEEPAERIRARIVDEIEKRLPPAGAREAVELLDRYLAYRERVRAMPGSGPADDLAGRLAELHEIRVEAFGDANAAALFGEEEAVQSADVERRKLLADTALSPEERERHLGEIEERLPPAVRQARSKALAALRLSRDEKDLLDAGGSPEDVRALREQRFGSQAADRLAALDEERAAWQRRVEDYRRARRALASDASLDADARERALAALVEERFTPQERIRVEALDRIEDELPDGR